MTSFKVTPTTKITFLYSGSQSAHTWKLLPDDNPTSSLSWDRSLGPGRVDTDAREYSSISISRDLNSKKWDLEFPAYKTEIILIISISFVLLKWKLYGKSIVCLWENCSVYNSETIVGFLLAFQKKQQNTYDCACQETNDPFELKQKQFHAAIVTN